MPKTSATSPPRQRPIDPAEPLLVVDDLAVSFDNSGGPRIQAVDGARMTVYPRQTLAIVGESGCGKSVTAMAAMHLIARPPGRIDRGSMQFASEDGQVDLLKLDEPAIRRLRGGQIAMIFQEPMTSLNPVYTVGDQIIEAITLHQDVGTEGAREVALRAMREVGIADAERRIDAYPHQFSGGMRQRGMIAMALACEPRLLLADEPTTALDVTIQAQILDLLREVQAKRQMGIVLITHALGVVAENADVVCVMYAGRVVEYATVFDLFDRPLHPYTRGLLASIPRTDRRAERLAMVSQITADEREFALPPDRGGSRAGRGDLVAWWPWRDAPAGVPQALARIPGGASTLMEVEPNHWVAVCSTEEVLALSHRFPDLRYRVSDDPQSALYRPPVGSGGLAVERA